MPESPPTPRRLRASIGEVMGLVALAALACVWPGLIPTEVVAVLAWVAARGGAEQARGRLVSLGMVLAALYLLPLANFFLLPGLDPAWSQLGPDWRREWSPIFPVTPGSLPLLLANEVGPLGRIRPDREDVVLAVLASLATAAVIDALTRLAGRSRGRRAVAATLGFLWSALSTFVMTVVVIARGV